MKFKIQWEEFALFLEVDKQHAQTMGGINGDKSRFKNFSEWFQGKDWSKDNLRLFLSHLKQRGLGQESLNKHISFARNIDEYLGVQESEGFRSKVVIPKRIKEILSFEQIRELTFYERPYKKYCDYLQKRQSAIILTLGSTGCRVGELLNLTWDNVGVAPRKHIFFPETKNGMEREVAISDGLWDMIQAIPRRNQYVFTSVRGSGVRPDGSNVLQSQEVNADIKERARALGIEIRVYPHLFRHSWATEMKRRGVSDSDICLIAGWKDPRMLLRYDGTDLDRIASIMEMHPLMQDKMTDLEKVKRLINNARLFYSSDSYDIMPVLNNGEITLTIKPLSL